MGVLLHLLMEIFYAARMELLEERIMHPLLTQKGKMLKDTYLGKSISIHLLCLNLLKTIFFSAWLLTFIEVSHPYSSKRYTYV